MPGMELATQAIMSFDATKTWTPESLFDAALGKIESASIRAWATSQRDVWLSTLVDSAKKTQADLVDCIAAYIILTALG